MDDGRNSGGVRLGGSSGWTSADAAGLLIFPGLVRYALKTYGMICADNGSDWYITGTHDKRWNNDEMASIRQVTGKDLEVVRMAR